MKGRTQLLRFEPGDDSAVWTPDVGCFDRGLGELDALAEYWLAMESQQNDSQTQRDKSAESDDHELGPEDDGNRMTRNQHLGAARPPYPTRGPEKVINARAAQCETGDGRYRGGEPVVHIKLRVPIKPADL
jgi:hypothetical protein